jgi:hypothetical protein
MLGNLLDIFLDTDLTVPAGQMFLYMLLVSLFLLFGRQRLCILTTFLFSFYWGFVLNKELFINRLGDVGLFLALYLGCGFLVILMALISFFIKQD